MKIIIGNDHAGVELKNKIKDYLLSKGYDVLNVGTDTLDSVDYPDIAQILGEEVLKSNDNLGILICGTGIGISIAANKVKGIRAALAHNELTAKLAREHNNANVLALGARVIGEDLAIATVESYLNAKFEGGRHERRVNKIEL